MRLLLDSCMSPKLVDRLAEAGHDVVWTGDDDPGDAAILVRALNEQRTIVTLDKDFGELAIRKGMEHAGIIRIVDERAQAHYWIIVSTIGAYEAELTGGAIVVASEGRVRLRRR